jgi:hypothetical protein
MEIDRQNDGAFKSWLLAKDERFYILFLVVTFVFFAAMSILYFPLIAGSIIAGVWMIFYFTIIRK